MTEAFVSVIVPCYNQGNFLEACLESVARSTVRYHEVLVINDGSTDRGTLRALDGLKPAAEHQELRIISKANGGLASARNAGIADASGDWIQFLDADDLLLPGSIDGRLEAYECSMRRAAAASRTAGVIGQYAILDDAAGQVWSPEIDQPNARLLHFSAVASRWERGVTLPIHCVLLRREALPTAPAFDEGLFSKEDWLFWMTVFADDWRFVQHDEVVALYRLHGGNMTRKSVVRNAFSWLEAAHIAHARWPERFTEVDLASAEEHWRDFYLMKLWVEIGPSLPWRLYSALGRATPTP